MKTFKITTCLQKTKNLFEKLALESKVHHSCEWSPDGEFDCHVSFNSSKELDLYIAVLANNVEYADIKDVVYQAMITI